MSAALVIDDDGNATFVPDGAHCENCDAPLLADGTVETEDMVLLCEDCAAQFQENQP